MTGAYAVPVPPTPVHGERHSSQHADVRVALKRGSVLASLKLRGARKLRRGGYALVLKLRGRTPVTVPVTLR